MNRESISEERELVMHASKTLLAFIAIGLVCAACSRDKAGSGASGTAQAAAAVTAPESIKIGQTMPYSGPASAYGTIGKIEDAYFKMINEQGGVNGKKIELMSLDDG